MFCSETNNKKAVLT